MRNPLMLLALLATSGAVILAAALQRRRLGSAGQPSGNGFSSTTGDYGPERRRGDRPEPPAPAGTPPPDNLEPFSRPGSADDRR